MRYFLALTVLVSAEVMAESPMENIAPREIATVKDLEQGWNRKVILGGTASLGTSDRVVGQTDGESTTLGLNLEGSLIHLKNRDEWRNIFKLGQSSAKTPSIPRYVKASDELKYETIYLHALESTPWFGPYVRGSVETAIFKGEDVRSEPKTYQRLDPDKNPIGSAEVSDTFRLTDGFRPLTTKESVGGFFKIIQKEKTKLEARLGIGAVQVQAKNQYALSDDNSTTEIEVRQLQSYEQVGGEGGFTLAGVFDAKTSYSLAGEFLTPFVIEKRSGESRSNFELTNWEVNARLTSKVYDWMSLDYTAKLLRKPQLVDDIQIQTLLMVSFNYQLL